MKFVRPSLLTNRDGTVQGQSPHLAVRFTGQQRGWLQTISSAQGIAISAIVRECVERVREQEGERLLAMLKARPATKEQVDG